MTKTMDLKCKLCKRISSCPLEDTPDCCTGRFGIDLEELIYLARDMAKEYNIEYTDALHTIEMGLRFGGCIDA